MADDMFRGYRIEEAARGYVFCDTGQLVAQTWRDRPCGHCGRHNTPEGHDGCLGEIAGAMNACCGHGRTQEAYIQFNDGTSVRGMAAIERFPHGAV